MQRFLAVVAFLMAVGFGAEAFAQSGYYPYTPAYPPQMGQMPTAGPPGYERDRDRWRRGRDIHIESAWYGIESRACDATRDARRLCEGRSDCTIPATNRLCGDPVPNVVKVLTVWYRCGHRPVRATTRPEGRYVGLRCD